MGTKPTKFSTKLPDREVLKGLMKSNMTINDYAKATPSKVADTAPLLQQMMTEQAKRR